VTVGLDRGIKMPLATSDGQAFVVGDVNAARIQTKEVRIKRFQRRMARQQLGSANRHKTRRRIARLKTYGAEVRRDFAHKASHALAASSAEVFVLEDLKLKNMTAAPAPRLDKPGRYTANGAAAKAGLNKALLASSLGLVKTLLTYKAVQRNKLVLLVSPYNSSNECAVCGHTEAGNRPSQAEFCCLKCGHTDNADFNAARVLKKRGIAMLVGKKVVSKRKKTARVRGKDKTPVVQSTVGPVRPEPGVQTGCPKPVENPSDVVGRTTQRSQKQETAT